MLSSELRNRIMTWLFGPRNSGPLDGNFKWIAAGFAALVLITWLVALVRGAP